MIAALLSRLVGARVARFAAPVVKWALIAVAVFLAATWLRWDAVRDYRAELEAKSMLDRLESIERDRDRDREIEGAGIGVIGELARQWVRDVPADGAAGE